MDAENYKEVDFSKYCATCENSNEDEGSDICNECLNEPARIFTRKPVNWKEKE